MNAAAYRRRAPHQHRRPGTLNRAQLNRAMLPSPASYYTEWAHLKPTGPGTWKTALCPFHADSRPSLRINTQTGGFCCMVCEAKGGDVLAFHMQRHGLGFIDACKALNAWEGQP